MNDDVTFADLRAKQAAFAAHIIYLCDKHDASITSWIRTQQRNLKVGGHPMSYHMIGLAADAVTDDQDGKIQLILEARALGLIAIDEDDHVHIQVPHADMPERHQLGTQQAREAALEDHLQKKG